MKISKKRLVLSLILVAAALAPAVVRAQAGDDLAARRQAILQQDQLVTDDGQIVDQNVTLIPATRATFRSSDSTPFQEVRWRRGYYGGYYGRPYGAYYGSRYAPYYGGGYGYRGYGPAYGYGYRGYGPSYGYYRGGDPYYYGGPYGNARVGRFRVFW